MASLKPASIFDRDSPDARPFLARRIGPRLDRHARSSALATYQIHRKLKSRFVDRVPRGLRVSTFSGPDAKLGKGKRPPVECVNAVEPGAGRAGDISSLLSVCFRRQAHCPMRFLFPIFQICVIAALGSQKRLRVRPEARRAWIAGRLLRSRRGSTLVARRCGGASSRVRARRRRPPRVDSPTSP